MNYVIQVETKDGWQDSHTFAASTREEAERVLEHWTRDSVLNQFGVYHRLVPKDSASLEDLVFNRTIRFGGRRLGAIGCGGHYMIKVLPHETDDDIIRIIYRSYEHITFLYEEQSDGSRRTILLEIL